MEEVNVIIEISKGGHIKYEYDKEKNMLVCDRILHTPMKYPFNYGFIPNTLSEDGDPLDVVILTEDELLPGCSIKCRILGYLDTADDAGNDPKLIVCPINKIDPTLENINDISTMLSNHTLNRIKYFFQHYKDLENKYVNIGEFHNKWTAISIYTDSKNRFSYKSGQKNKITNYFKLLNI
jgi:inorganic pyrophosphatase